MNLLWLGDPRSFDVALARMYPGVPDKATARSRDGQMIVVDGNKGIVRLLDGHTRIVTSL